MNLSDRPFLGEEYAGQDPSQAGVVILPVPYEGGASYGRGTADAPAAVLDASAFLEVYDEVDRTEPWRVGVATLAPATVGTTGEDLVQGVEARGLPFLQRGALSVMIGGDHSITTGALRAMQRVHPVFSVLQIDAHADLRDAYEGSPLSHACVMARARELTPHTAQLGIRSMSPEEAQRIARERLSVHTMHAYRTGKVSLPEVLDALPDPLYITLDVDALDWSVVASTGTPEPGGFTWDEILKVLETVFARRQVAGFDVVELSAREGDNRSPFAVAKLIHKMIAMRFRASLPRLPET